MFLTVLVSEPVCPVEDPGSESGGFDRWGARLSTESEALRLLATLGGLELVLVPPSGDVGSSLIDVLERLLRVELVELTLGVRVCAVPSFGGSPRVVEEPGLAG